MQPTGSGRGTPPPPPDGGSGGDGPAGPPGRPDPAPAHREGDRLRFVGAATRRIARGLDLDEIVMGLCRATVPTFADAILVYLRDPLPVGDERPVGPVVLRLRRTDRIPEHADSTEDTGSFSTEGTGLVPSLQLQAQPDLTPAAELCEVRPGGALAEVLRGVRPVFGDAPAAQAALPELLGDGRSVPQGRRAYALTLSKRLKAMGQAKYQLDGDPRTSGPGFGLTLHPDVLDAPLRWRKPRRVFVNSMSDLFHPAVPSDFICRVWEVMGLADHHTYQVLTKRPLRMAALLAWKITEAEARRLWPHVWLGTSIELDRYAFRADHLRATPAAVRFLSLEPLLGPLPSLDLTGIDWVIVGGESGPKARPMDLGWARDLIAQCRESGAKPFVKQLGSCWSGRYHRDLMGGDITTFPADLQVRESPDAR